MLIKTKVKKIAEAERKAMQEKETVKKSAPKANIVWVVALCGIYVIVGILGVYIYNFRQNFSAYEDNMAAMEIKLAQRVDDNRKIYMYNMEETLKLAGIPESSQKFESDIASLEREVQEAQEKIKTLKEAQVKEEFSEMYLRSLKMKRDELISKYSESMQDVLSVINSALEEVARENNVHTIFMANAIAISTEYVVDVTPQVVKKMQEQMGKQK